MEIEIRLIEKEDLQAAATIWNEVVQEGIAFPQTEILDTNSAEKFFSSQTATAVAQDIASKKIVGVYILHPNNVGRCGHICNASFAVKNEYRGNKIGEKMVVDCQKRAKECGFLILQFNAVVSTNQPALKLYKKLGFCQLGEIKYGFLLKNGKFESIIPHYKTL